MVASIQSYFSLEGPSVLLIREKSERGWVGRADGVQGTKIVIYGIVARVMFNGKHPTLRVETPRL